MAMHFGMYFTTKNTTYGAIQVLRTRMGGGGRVYRSAQISVANVICVTRGWSSQLSRKSC